MFWTILGLIENLLKLILAIPKWVADSVKSGVDKNAEDRTKNVEKGVEDARKAQTVEEKANAACEIEHAIDPDSTCD